MKKRLFLISFVLAVFMPLILFSYDIKPMKIGVGEYMEFKVKIFGSTVAIQKLKVLDIVDVDGVKCYKIKADIQSVPWISKIYKLHDIAYEYIDVNTLTPVKIKSKIHEGSWTNTVFIDIDRKNNKLHYKDKRSDKVLKYKGTALGLISLIYYARTMVPKKGEKITFVISNKDKLEYIHSVVKSTNAAIYLKKFRKKFFAYLYEQIGGRNVALWISKDKHRLPVRMISMKLKIAGYGITNIEAWLIKYKPGNL